MHIFITGATGLIGSAIMALAVGSRHAITALVRSEAHAKLMRQVGATPLQGDIADPAPWIARAAGADCFIHLANSFDAQMADTEPRLLAALAAHVAHRRTPLRLLYTGGCWLYGETRNAVATEASPLRPIATFEWAAKAINTLQNTAGLSTAVLHPAMVYDEGGGAFTRMLTALRAKRPAPIWGSSDIRWPLVHSFDAGSAYLALANCTATGPFNIVAEQGVPTGEIARVLHEQAGVKTKPAILPGQYALMRHGPMAEGPMLDQQMASTRMKEQGWAPEITNFSRLTYDL